MNLKTFGDPNLAAVLLKKYLRDLPEPLFPERLYPIIKRCPIPSSDPSDMSSVTYIRETLLPELPPCAYILLSHYLRKCGLCLTRSRLTPFSRTDERGVPAFIHKPHGCPQPHRGVVP